MFRIKFNSKGLYEFHTIGGAWEGQLSDIVKKACQAGMDAEEVHLAIQNMASNGNVVAEFGGGGCFLYSHDGEEAA